MLITFRNNDEYCKVILTYSNHSYTLEPKGELALSFFGKVSFTAEIMMPDFSGELNVDRNKDKLHAKVMKRLAKKLVNKFPEMVLSTVVTYELTDTTEDCSIFFSDGNYSVCDGYVADFFDMMPVDYFFAGAETSKGTLRITDVKTVNRKQFLRLQRIYMLVVDWGLILPDLFLFIPKYMLVRLYYTADFYVSKKVKDFYRLDPSQRIELICEKKRKREKIDKGSGCFKIFLWLIISFALLIGFGIWMSSGEPDVVMDENYSQVVCFDEVFVRTDGGLPSDAEETFLEDYTVEYQRADGSYDILNYQCHIYEDSAGNRYMWVKTDCSNPTNYDKDYEDYENPLVFRSVGEMTEG